VSRRAPLIEIRPARADDARDISEISAEAFAEYSRNAASSGAGMMQRPDARTWVATERAVVGFVIVRRGDGDTAWLDAIAVSPSARGRGVGRLLLASAELEAKRAGARTLGLATADSNLAALDLFLAAGFVIERRVPRYYERGQTAVEMKKRLAPA